MVGRTSDWKKELGRFLKPFLDRFGHKARRQMCPLYVSGLIRSWRSQKHSADGGAGRLGDYDQLHHFIAAGIWDARPVETELLVQADRLVGGRRDPAGGLWGPSTEPHLALLWQIFRGHGIPKSVFL